MEFNRIIINRKICDNAPECSGIEVCPSAALYWDDSLGEIVFDNDVCLGCQACVEACPVGAIRWAEDEINYEEIQDEIRKDPHSYEELAVERFGAVPIEEVIHPDQIQDTVENAKTKFVVLELFNDSSINCLLHSIRVADIKEWFSAPVSYHKVQLSEHDSLPEGVDELPALLIYKESQNIGCVFGYYDDSSNSTRRLKKKIRSIINYK